ncbi:response regulator transcription factor [Acuticoccus mangrovi]|uniref:Response regulator transcription factor n=1 Tax=Acuticoccus mangrovi TaxID=2796142 RepID=A0A934IGH8_9HYPH|nr:response regulator transcription factor [Acuticoccus mangrovi]MBJ3774556.1 response regulator transcription factor [Acuticoccus mangrovi]
MRLLLVEDDRRVAAHIAKGLGEAGHTVDVVGDGREGLYRTAGESYDAVILDRMLPEVDGLTILRTMRAAGNTTPVVILSALGEVDERVTGLKAGGDDYLVKPFAMSELIARLEVQVRRTAPAGERMRLEFADLALDLATREARRGGRRIDLTPREFLILEYMMRHARQVVTRSMLLERVWNYQFDPQTNIIDQHMSRLRQKVDHLGERQLIQTVRGAGYALREED